MDNEVLKLACFNKLIVQFLEKIREWRRQRRLSLASIDRGVLEDFKNRPLSRQRFSRAVILITLHKRFTTYGSLKCRQAIEKFSKQFILTEDFRSVVDHKDIVDVNFNHYLRISKFLFSFQAITAWG